MQNFVTFLLFSGTVASFVENNFLLLSLKENEKLSCFWWEVNSAEYSNIEELIRLRQRTIIHRSEGKYLHYSPTLTLVIALTYTSQNHFHRNFFWNFYNFTECGLVAHSSFVNKTFWNLSWVHFPLKSKRNTYLWILNCQVLLLLWCCLTRRLRLLTKKFFRKVNIAGRHLVLFVGE